MEIRNPGNPQDSAARPIDDGQPISAGEIPIEEQAFVAEETIVDTTDGEEVIKQTTETVVDDVSTFASQQASRAQEAAPFQEAYQQPQPQPQPSAYQQPQTQAAYAYPPVEPSPFSLGWQDVKNTPDAVSSIGFKGLVNCVPILNFCFYGMAGKWGREPVDGIVRPAPKKVIDSDNLIAGFLYFVISLVFGFALGIVNVFPVIGQIITFVSIFFIGTLALMMFFRYLSFGSFAEAWNLKDIWDKAKRNFGSLWVASFVPNLIVGAISGVACLIIILLFGTISGVSTFNAFQTGSVASLFGMIGSIGIGSILCFVIVMFASAVGMLWSCRATGYWIARYAPEWNSGNAQAELAAKESMRAQQVAEAQARYQAQVQAQQAQTAAWQTQQAQGYAASQQPAYDQPYTPQQHYQTSCQHASQPQQPSTPVAANHQQGRSE